MAGVTGSKIDVSFNLTFEGRASWTSTQDAVKAAIQSYFDSLARTWADTEKPDRPRQPDRNEGPER